MDAYIQNTLQGAEKQGYNLLEDLAKQINDPIELRSQVLSILFGSRDTTAALIGWTFYYLARNPEMFRKLRSHILKDFGRYQQQENSITFTGLRSCQYLQNCLNKASRMAPAIPVNSRQCVKDCILPRGGGRDGQSPVFIEKGMEIRYSIFVMHLDKEIWGDDAGEFRPERWTGRKVGWEFLPFNGGPRVRAPLRCSAHMANVSQVCIGQQYAVTLAGFTAVRLLQRFDAIEDLDSTEVKYSVGFITKSGAGVQIRLHEADSEH